MTTISLLRWAVAAMHLRGLRLGLGAIWSRRRALKDLPDPIQFLALTMAFSILYTWIYNNARASLFLIALVHGVTNTFAAFLFPSQFGEFYLRLWWLYAELWWVATLLILVRANVQTKAGKTVLSIQNPTVTL